jgi:hypothetical protein
VAWTSNPTLATAAIITRIPPLKLWWVFWRRPRKKICPSLLPSTKDQLNLSDSEGGIKKITVDEQDGKKNKQTQRAETLGWWLAFCGVGSSDHCSCAVEAIRQPIPSDVSAASGACLLASGGMN